MFEIEVPFTGETPFPQRDALEAALDNALTEGDVGEVMGAGSGPGETFDLAAEIDARKRKTGLRLIRKVLKSCKAPPTTKIYEIDPSTLERVELPLSDS